MGLFFAAKIGTLAIMARPDSEMTIATPLPDLALETAAQECGHVRVTGVDEAGRGPLAGAVVAAAVVLDPANIPAGLNDSKKLTEARREVIFLEIMEKAQVGFCAAPVSVIDNLNIRGATLWAMTQAVAALPFSPDLALIDGRDVPPGLPCKGEAVIGGDARSLSIAAASIVAKVMRDRMCGVIHQSFPQYGFAKHKGYGTAFHLEALNAHGPSELHRTSFAPVRAAMR